MLELHEIIIISHVAACSMNFIFFLILVDREECSNLLNFKYF